MKKSICLTALLVLVLVLGLAAVAQAAPKSGFGLYGAYASWTDDVSIEGGGTATGKASGLGFGLDYQFAVSDTISINPFLEWTSGSGSGDYVSGVTVDHTILGVQVRYWIDALFLEGHLGSYGLHLSGNGDSESASAVGYGLGAGWESPDGGLFVGGHLDSVSEIEFSDATVDSTGLTIYVGYRWK